ncbi:MAG: DUF3754 domain-containing protein [Planctomycetota bacterium]
MASPSTEPDASSQRQPQTPIGRAMPARAAASKAVEPVDTRFIPARPEVLAELIAADPDCFGPDAGRAPELLSAIDRVIAQETAALHDRIDRDYAALNPDEDAASSSTDGEDDGGPEETAEAAAEDRAEGRLLDALGYVLDKANFTALSQVEIEAALAAGTSYGVRVHLDSEAVQHLALHVRGVATRTRLARSRRKPWKRVETPIDVYRRLVVVTRLRGETGVRLKLFRDIPVRDVEALMPHARIKMSWLDQAQVYGGGAGALGGLGSKLLAFVAGASVTKGTLGWAALIGFGGLAFKSFTGYRRTRHRRSSQRTQNLYERTLGSNAAVLHTLVRMIRQEEGKEALLIYSMLRRPARPVTEPDLDRCCEAWIATTFGRHTDFDAPDAIETLERLQLWQDREALTVVDPAAAPRRLGQHWQDRRSEGYHAHWLDRVQRSNRDRVTIGRRR